MMGMACSMFGAKETWYRKLVWKQELDDMREISGLPAELLACQNGICSLQSATCLTFTGPNSTEILLRSALYQAQIQDKIHIAF